MLKINSLHIFVIRLFSCNFVAVGYTKSTLDLKWLDNAVDIDPDLELPQFKLLDEIQEDCSQNYTAGK